MDDQIIQELKLSFAKFCKIESKTPNNFLTKYLIILVKPMVRIPKLGSEGSGHMGKEERENKEAKWREENPNLQEN